MKDKRKYLIFCMIFVANSSFAQLSGSKSILNARFSPFPGQLLPNPYPLIFQNGVIQQDFSAKNMGFFCRQEYKLETITKIPFRFRLGSVASCDWMEGKKGSINPQR